MVKIFTKPWTQEEDLKCVYVPSRGVFVPLEKLKTPPEEPVIILSHKLTYGDEGRNVRSNISLSHNGNKISPIMWDKFLDQKEESVRKCILIAQEYLNEYPVDPKKFLERQTNEYDRKRLHANS